MVTHDPRPEGERDRPLITVPDMCERHQQILVHQADYRRTDPWRELIVLAQLALLQGASTDPRVHERIGPDFSKISTLGCLACLKPDLFGELVEVAKTHDLSEVAGLGTRWVTRAAAANRGS